MWEGKAKWQRRKTGEVGNTDAGKEKRAWSRGRCSASPKVSAQKKIKWTRRDGSAVKSICRSYGRAEFGSQYLHCNLQQPVTPAPLEPTPSSCLYVHVVVRMCVYNSQGGGKNLTQFCGFWKLILSLTVTIFNYMLLIAKINVLRLKNK